MNTAVGFSKEEIDDMLERAEARESVEHKQMIEDELLIEMANILWIEPDTEENGEGFIYGNSLTFPPISSIEEDNLKLLAEAIIKYHEIRCYNLVEILAQDTDGLISFVEPYYPDWPIEEESLPNELKFWKKEYFDYEYDFATIDYKKFEESMNEFKKSVYDSKTGKELTKISQILLALVITENQSKALIMNKIETEMNASFSCKESRIYKFTHEKFKETLSRYPSRKKMTEEFFGKDVPDYTPYNNIRNFLAHRIDEAKLKSDENMQEKLLLEYKDKNENIQHIDIEVIFESILQYIHFLQFHTFSE